MTVTEIAKLAGVSIGTVDRVLHNRGRVSEETRQKIQDIITQSGYQPDPLARHLKKHVQYHIGVLIPEIESAYGYWQQLYDGITSTAETEFGAFSLVIKPYFFRRPDPESLSTQFARMTSSGCSAYIIAPVMQEETSALLTSPAVTVPYCLVDSPLPGCSPVTTISQNPYDAGYLAGRMTKLIAAREGTYAALISFSQAFNQSERARGFCDWFEKNERNSSAVCVRAAESTQEGIASETEKIISSYHNLAGICTMSVEVQFVSAYFEQYRNKNNIAITGFELVNKNRAQLASGAIDCLIDQQPREQGRLAVQQLFRKLVYEEEPEQKIIIPLELFFKENLP